MKNLTSEWLTEVAREGAHLDDSTVAASVPTATRVEISASTRKGQPIVTFKGTQFWPLDPRPEEVDIETIAHSLANQCRWGGHPKRFYSVAEHCVRVSWACPSVFALHGLLHDAHEAYLVDLPRPVKKMLPEYEGIARLVDGAIFAHLDLPLEPLYGADVARADEILLATEARDLIAGHVDCSAKPLQSRILDTWSPFEARKKYLALFHNLMRGYRSRHAST